MKTKITTVLFLSIFGIIILTSGCQENNTANNKRARLVGNENLQLKKQLAAETKKHKAALEECEKRVQQQILANQQLGDRTLNTLMESLDRSIIQDELILENQQLKEKITELELELNKSQ